MDKRYSEGLFGGCLKDYGTYMAGTFQTCPLTFWQENNNFVVTVSTYVENEDSLTALKNELKALRKSFPKLTSASFASKTQVKLVVAPKLSFKKNLADLNSLVDQLVDFMLYHGNIRGCAQCGSPEYPPELYEVNGRPVFLCTACAARIEQETLVTRDEVSAQSSNLFAGLVGALIGSLAGVAVWLLLDQLGFIAGISGALMAIGAMWLYAKLGGCLDKKGVICCIIVVAVMVFAANYLAYGIAYFKVLKPYGYTFGDCFKYQFQFLKMDEIVGGYIINLIIGYGLTAVACVPRFAQAMKSTSGPTFKKLS